MTYEITDITHYEETSYQEAGKIVTVKISGLYTCFDIDRIQEETGATILVF